MRADSMEAAALPGSRVLAAVLVLGGIGTIVYWITFFTAGGVQATQEECYLVFERAFPAADGWTAAAAIVGGLGLWRRRATAVLFGIAAGSGFIFLGLMDVLYNLENGMYELGNPEMVGEIVINIFCLTVGPTAMAYVWRHRSTLDPRSR